MAGEKEKADDTSGADVSRAYAGFALRRVRPANDGDGPWTVAQRATDAPMRSGIREPLFAPPEPLKVRKVRLPPGVEPIPSPDDYNTGRQPPEGPTGPDPTSVAALLRARRQRIGERRAANLKGRVDTTAPDPVATALTLTAHHKCANGLLARYRRENEVRNIEDDDLDPMDLVEWFYSLRGHVSEASWRVYRVAMQTKVRTMPHERMQAALAILENDAGAGAGERRAYQRVRCAPNLSTELPLARLFAKRHFDLMIAEASLRSRSKATAWLSDWLIASVYTGLMPEEWTAVDLETRADSHAPTGRRAWLYVINMKASQPQGPVVARTLDISDFSADSFSAVERMMKKTREWVLAGEFVTQFSKTQQLCYTLSVELFPRLGTIYSLYSLRHQFILNMAAVCDDETASALVGDFAPWALIDSSNKRKAWQSQEIIDRPLPMQSELARVRKISRLHNERATIIAARNRRSRVRHKPAKYK